MLRLTRTAIGLLTRQYRSVLQKCWLINVGAWLFGAIGKTATTLLSQTLRGTLKMSGTEIFKVLDGLFAKRAFKQKLVTTTAIGLAVTAITMPTEAEAGYAWDWNNNRLTIATPNSNYNENGLWIMDASTTNQVVKLWNGLGAAGGALLLSSSDQQHTTELTNRWFSLNNSSNATGIDFASNVSAGTTAASHLATTGSVTQMLSNNYYRKNKKSEILNGFEAGKIGNENDDNFSKFRAVNGDFVAKNGDFVSNNPSRLGAFSKCEKACSRLSERFPASLEKNSAFEQYSRSARGTFLFVSQTHKNVLDNFYKNSQCLKASNDNFATTTFLRAI